MGFFRPLGHQMFLHTAELFSAASPRHPGKVAGPEETEKLGMMFKALTHMISLRLHLWKCEFEGKECLEILGILVDA